MTEYTSLEQSCNFETERLLVQSWKEQVASHSREKCFAKKVINILTHEVTKSLPDGWQGIDSVDKALDWIRNRAKESAFLTIQFLYNQEVVGFIFLFETISADNSIDLRLGYLLSEAVWGKGLGSELIKGLVDWCEDVGNIKSISGGVEIDNVGSIKVLERNGFNISTTENPPENTIFLERKFNH